MRFSNTFGIGQLVYNGLSLLIVVQSMIARFGFIKLTEFMRFTAETSKMRFLIVFVFTIFFINYGVLYVVVPMKTNFPIVSKLIQGLYWDFN